MKRGVACTIVLGMLSCGLPARAAVFSIGADQDNYEAQDTHDATNPNGDGIGDGVQFGVSGALRIGSRTVNSTSGFGTAVCMLIPFELPALAPGEEVSAASLSILTKNQTSNLPVANADLYGLPFDATPVDIDQARYFEGATDSTAGVSKLQDNFLVPADASAPDMRHISVDISAYVQSLYDAGAVAGDFAILRLSYDQTPDLHAHNRYLVWQRLAARSTLTDNDPSLWPYLNIETTLVPEPGSLALCGLLGAGMLWRRRSFRS